MSAVPDPHALATKLDIAELRAELKAEIAELKAEIKADIAELKADMAGLKADNAWIRWIITGGVGLYVLRSLIDWLR